MNDFISQWDDAIWYFSKMITSLFEKHPGVWKDDEYREMTLNILIRIGTNMLLSEDAPNVRGALDIAKTIVVLENHVGDSLTAHVYNSRRVQTKLRCLDKNVSSCRRDVLKFFSKRISCSCLKEMHQEAKRTLPKMLRCSGCFEEKERVSLSVCSRCMTTQYCSRECQVAYWYKHKRPCDVYVRAHEEVSQKA